MVLHAPRSAQEAALDVLDRVHALEAEDLLHRDDVAVDAGDAAFGRDARNLAIAPQSSAGLHDAADTMDGLDGHFAGWDGTARIAWPDGHGLTLRATGAWASNLHVFAPTGGSALAVEPVSHAPDAPNRPAAAAHGAMHQVMPGGSLEGSLTIHWV